MTTVAEHHSSSINNSRLASHEDDLASKFGALGFVPSQGHPTSARSETRSNNSRSTRQPYVPPRQQQQFLVDAILAPGQGTPTPTSQQDLLALLQLQQAQAAVTQNPHLHAQLVLQAQAQQALLAAQSRQNMSAAQQQYLQQLSLAAQPRSPLTPQDPALKVGDRLVAQGYKGRDSKPEVDARSRFENAPSPRLPAFLTPKLQSNSGIGQPHSPFSKEVAWQSSFSPSIPSPASALRTSESPATNIAQRRRPEGAGLAVLARRTDGSQSGESRTTSPTSPAFPVSARLGTPNLLATPQMPGQATLGHGRPINVLPSPRAWTASAAEVATAKTDLAPRAASYSGTAAPRIVVLRQPFGPPGEASELGDRNFQARIRKQAGRGLGLLSRRGDTPASTPILE